VRARGATRARGLECRRAPRARFKYPASDERRSSLDRARRGRAGSSVLRDVDPCEVTFSKEIFFARPTFCCDFHPGHAPQPSGENISNAGRSGPAPAVPRRRRRAQTDSRARLVRVALRSHLPPSSPR
jgi:hypothetical protein